MKIAYEILKQLGGHKFRVMTGASNFIELESGIGFKIPRNKSKANYVRIKLTVMDTYKFEFIRIHGHKVTTIEEFDNVYCDQLTSIFESVTGMVTEMPLIIRVK